MLSGWSWTTVGEIAVGIVLGGFLVGLLTRL